MTELPIISIIVLALCVAAAIRGIFLMERDIKRRKRATREYCEMRESWWWAEQLAEDDRMRQLQEYLENREEQPYER